MTPQLCLVLSFGTFFIRMWNEEGSASVSRINDIMAGDNDTD